MCVDVKPECVVCRLLISCRRSCGKETLTPARLTTCRSGASLTTTVPSSGGAAAANRLTTSRAPVRPRYAEQRRCACPLWHVRRISEWTPRPFDELIIYEMHVGSFTPEGTFAATAAKLHHVRDCGFTCIQLMPLCEHSDPWGYNPRQYLNVHSLYGTPDDLRRLVDVAHGARDCQHDGHPFPSMCFRS